MPSRQRVLGAALGLAVGVVVSGCPSESERQPQPTPPATGLANSSPSTAPRPDAGASARPLPSASAHAAAPSRPLYFERAIEPADLEGRTLRELSLLRNTIYARVGNSFRRPWLHEHFSAQAWYKPQAQMDESKLSQLDRDNAKKIAEHDSSLPHEELERMRDVVLGRKKAGQATPEDAVELSLLSQRLGTYLGEGDDTHATPLEDPAQLDHLLKVEDLSTLSRRDLRILRNTVYARRGRAFDSKVVRSYFESASWYKPSAEYHDGVLTGVDHKNIKIIRSVEDSLGGPLHENPNYGKDGWFVMA